jgi:hypothetical protein
MLVGYGLKYRTWIPVRGTDFYFRDGAHTGFNFYPATISLDISASFPNGNHPQPEVSCSPPSGVEVKSGRICTYVPLVYLYGMALKHWYAYLLQ